MYIPHVYRVYRTVYSCTNVSIKNYYYSLIIIIIIIYSARQFLLNRYLRSTVVDPYSTRSPFQLSVTVVKFEALKTHLATDIVYD